MDTDDLEPEKKKPKLKILKPLPSPKSIQIHCVQFFSQNEKPAGEKWGGGGREVAVKTEIQEKV